MRTTETRMLRRRRGSAPAVAALALLAVSAGLAPARASAPPVAVYVSYAENERTPIFWPDPWLGSPKTIFLGDSGPSYDAGAILLRNNGHTSVTLAPGAYVDGFMNGAVFQLWDGLIGSGITIPPGWNCILTETAYRNF
ncbi:MAG TPA: hypothetical protein VGS41_03805, partial [Chthonomonadales bacterium]|nr:hypothetical protein [Chthonomonadales bacterium]